MNVVCAKLNGNAQQFLVANIAEGFTVQEQSKSTGNSIGRTLAVNVNTAFFYNAQGLIAFGAEIVYRMNIVCVAAMRTLNSDFAAIVLSPIYIFGKNILTQNVLFVNTVCRFVLRLVLFPK